MRIEQNLSVSPSSLSLCRRQCNGGAGAWRGGRQSGGQTGRVRQRGRREAVGYGYPPGGGQTLRLLH